MAGMRDVCASGLASAVLLSGALLPPPAGAIEEEDTRTTASGALSFADLEQRGYRIGSIQIVVANVFDESKPGEDNRLFRLANRVHVTTRPAVIRELLLFATGDPVCADRIAETERILRQQRYFYDVRIHPVRVADGVVDVEIVTRDVWSLAAGVNFKRSGGTNATRLRAEDTNFLGLGRQVALLYESNIDRDDLFAHYEDTTLLGSRLQLDLGAGRASDGSTYRLSLARPFFALDSRWSAGVSVARETRVDSLYDGGRVTDRFGHRISTAELYAGVSPGLTGGKTHRFTGGATWERHGFGSPDTTGRDPLPGRVPPDRAFVYPWLGWEWVHNRFVVATDLDKIERSEDLNLGGEASFRLGYASTSWGSSRDAVIVSGLVRDAVRVGSRQLLLLSASLDGRRSRRGIEDLLASFQMREFVRDLEHGRLLISLRLDAARNLSADRQLLLGGDNGLRGYPLRFQQGDRLALFTVEQRLYDDREYLHLFRVGAAAFFDAGKAWFSDSSRATGVHYGLLRDVGVGLRVATSRSARAAMVHVDVALPLDGPKTISSVQWLVTTSETF